VSSPETTYDIVVTNLSKRFGEHQVLKDLSLKVKKGETYVLLGPSGSGKSVFLKHIAALIMPDSGVIEILGKNIHQLPPDELLKLRRRVGMVFQSAALFNSLTVEENVSLALSEHNLYPPDRIRDIVNEKLALVQMQNTNNLLPEEISGGMKKRVAVARTLALEPDIILFDEPTTGLDPIMARNVDELISDLKEHVGLTSVVVSHDLAGAFAVADRIGMIYDTRLIAEATPEEFRNIDNEIVHKFISRSNTGRT